MSVDLNSLIATVQHNCDVSDAQHAGVFSVCGLALRLRDLYKWERGLQPWEEAESSQLLEWIGAREERWDALAGEGYRPLAAEGAEIDPFDSEAVNAALLPAGLCYGAGYARGLKPTFFVAEVHAVQEDLDGCRVVTLGRELARDLLTLPALAQERTILLRRDSAARALWDLFAFIAPSARRAMDAALDACGIPDHSPGSVRGGFDRLARVQEELHLRHEIGEIHETGFPRERWREIVTASSLTRVELAARRVKDFLADTHERGPLPSFCRARHTAGMALYMAAADRVARALFPEPAQAFDALLETGSWDALERAVASGRRAALAHADAMLEAHAAGPGRLEAVVEERFGAALGRLPQEAD